jgi:hypothetical protein
MRPRTLLMAALASLAQPQLLYVQRRGVSRIGWITAQQPASLAALLSDFRAGLAGLGYAAAAPTTLTALSCPPVKTPSQMAAMRQPLTSKDQPPCDHADS